MIGEVSDVRLLFGSLFALIVVVVAKKKVDKKIKPIKHIDTTGVDWKDVDVKKE